MRTNIYTRDTARPMRLPLLCRSLAAAASLFIAPLGGHASTEDLLRMSEQLDRLDQLDLQDSLAKAQHCTSARDFPCAATTLKSARKLVHSPRDKANLAAAEAELAAEQQRVEDEERALAERERELQLAEERLMQEEAQARRRADAEEEESMSTGQAVALFGSLLSQSLRNQAAIRAAEARNARNFQAMNAQVSADVARQQQRFAQERAKIEAQRSALRRPPTPATPTTIASAASSGRTAPLAPPPTTGRTTTGTAVASGPGSVRGLESVSQETLAQIGARVANVDLDKLGPAGGKSGGASAPVMPTPPVQIPAPSVAYAPTQAEFQRMAPSPKPSSQPAQERPATPAPKAPADPREPDADGCIDAIGWCSTSHSMEQRGTTTFLRFKNTCPFRVYGTFINGRADGGKDAGATGVPAGGTHTWTTSHGSGRGYIRIVGSNKASMDWVCNGRMNGFTAGDSTLNNR